MSAMKTEKKSSYFIFSFSVKNFKQAVFWHFIKLVNLLVLRGRKSKLI